MKFMRTSHRGLSESFLLRGKRWDIFAIWGREELRSGLFITVGNFHMVVSTVLTPIQAVKNAWFRLRYWAWNLARKIKLHDAAKRPCLTPEDCKRHDYCRNCARYYSLLYPQGWSYYPGDICEHGVYVGGCGVDWMCGYCEAGPDYRPTWRERFENFRRRLPHFFTVHFKWER